MTISKEDMKILLKSQQGELDVVLMYKALADVVKDKNDAATFKACSRGGSSCCGIS